MRLLINTKLNYILFSPDVNFYTGQPINGRTVMYYLLYNPFHSKEFQNYYKNLLEISGESINSGYQKFKNDLTPTVQSASESAPYGTRKEDVKSFEYITKKYCNALQVGGDTLYNYYVAEHYLDPTCNLVLSDELTRMSSILEKNYTAETLKFKFFAPPRPADENIYTEDYYIKGREAYKGEAGALLETAYKNVPGSNPNIYWPCPFADKELVGDEGPRGFLIDTGLIGPSVAEWRVPPSNSFLPIFLNMYITSKVEISPDLSNEAKSNIINEPRLYGCRQQNLQLNSCNVLYFAGNFTNSQVGTVLNCSDNDKGSQDSKNTKIVEDKNGNEGLNLFSTGLVDDTDYNDKDNDKDNDEDIPTPAPSPTITTRPADVKNPLENQGKSNKINPIYILIAVAVILLLIAFYLFL